MAKLPTQLDKDLQLAENTLARMLCDRRAWASYMDIVTALNNLRRHAEDMRREQADVSDSGSKAPIPDPVPVKAWKVQEGYEPHVAGSDKVMRLGGME